MTELPEVVRIPEGVVSRDVNGQRVVLNVRTGLYFGLDGVSARVWELLEQKKPSSDICSAIVSEYDVDYERCVADVKELMESLEQNGLIVVGAKS